MKVRVTKELTGAWEIWEYDIPSDANLDLPGFEEPADNGVLVDEGFDSAEVTSIETVE